MSRNGGLPFAPETVLTCRLRWGLAGKETEVPTIQRIGATVGNFVVIGLVALAGAITGLAVIQLWAASSVPGNGIAHDILVAVGTAFNYSTKGL